MVLLNCSTKDGGGLEFVSMDFVHRLHEKSFKIALIAMSESKLWYILFAFHRGAILLKLNSDCIMISWFDLKLYP